MSDQHQDGPLVAVDPSKIYFTFARIRPRFSCNRLISDTMQQIIDGTFLVTQLPPILVLQETNNDQQQQNDCAMFSMNNRRLYLFKELQRRGILQTVMARVRPVPATRRMKQKYSTETCKLEAKLMPDRPKKSAAASGENDDDDEEQQQDASGDDDEVDDDNPVKRNPAPQPKKQHQQPQSKPQPKPKAQQQSKAASLADELSALKSKQNADERSSSDDDDDNDAVAPPARPMFVTSSSKRKRK